MPGITQCGSKVVEPSMTTYLSKRGDGGRGKPEHAKISAEPLLSDDDCSDGESGMEHLKMKMKLSWLERENVDLEVEKGRLANENRLLRAERDSLQTADQSSNLEFNKLNDKLAAITDKINHKELELAMSNMSLKEAEEAERVKQDQAAEARDARAENAQLKTKARELEDALDALGLEHDAIKAQDASHRDQMLALKAKNERMQPDHADLKASNDNLQVKIGSLQLRLDVLARDKRECQQTIAGLKATNNSLESTIKVLSPQIPGPAGKGSADVKELERARREVAFYKSKMDNLELDLKNAKGELATAIANRDWHKQEHVQMLTERNARNAERAQDGAAATRVRSGNARLKKDNKELRKEIERLKWNIGFYITDLDLAEAGLRVFDCRHNRFQDIPDGTNSTREKTAGIIASEFFSDWSNDKEFVQEYLDARLTILNHHRAHEQAKQGRGVHSSVIYKEMRNIDARRKVTTTYH